ncbi:MAG TPA: hypothetical protein ENN05_02040 [Deltaproteobacteria bacterium]|nr:hypothetical protein [Deltaproteobacteria bacterium]
MGSASCRVIMYRLVFAMVVVLLVYGCCRVQSEMKDKVMPSGREQVLRAVKPTSGTFTLLGRSGVLSTMISSSTFNPLKPLKGLDRKGSHGGTPFDMVLGDGTKVGGLFFEYNDGNADPKPLIIASFGFLQDRWGTEAAKFYNLYIKDPAQRIPAHVLILDHPSAGPFLACNACLSMGSYDDARMWIEIALHLKNTMELSGIHVFGVSMSGQSVVHALIEDKRLGLGLFNSGMVFSIAPDFQKAPGKQLAQLKTPEGIANPWTDYFGQIPEMTLLERIQNTALWMLMKKQFIPGYNFVRSSDIEFTLNRIYLAVFFRKAFEYRIAFLREHAGDSWNHEEISLADLDAFMASTRIAGVIDRVDVPLVLVSAYDDPAVKREMFAEVRSAAQGNPWVVAFETDNGGHFGFNAAYGKDYIGDIVRLMLNRQVIDTWVSHN